MRENVPTKVVWRHDASSVVIMMQGFCECDEPVEGM